jgi:hypothetical protein
MKLKIWVEREKAMKQEEICVSLPGIPQQNTTD